MTKVGSWLLAVCRAYAIARSHSISLVGKQCATCRANMVQNSWNSKSLFNYFLLDESVRLYIVSIKSLDHSMLRF